MAQCKEKKSGMKASFRVHHLLHQVLFPLLDAPLPGPVYLAPALDTPVVDLLAKLQQTKPEVLGDKERFLQMLSSEFDTFVSQASAAAAPCPAQASATAALCPAEPS